VVPFSPTASLKEVSNTLSFASTKSSKEHDKGSILFGSYLSFNCESAVGIFLGTREQWKGEDSLRKQEVVELLISSQKFYIHCATWLLHASLHGKLIQLQQDFHLQELDETIPKLTVCKFRRWSSSQSELKVIFKEGKKAKVPVGLFFYYSENDGDFSSSGGSVSSDDSHVSD
jgi:hypothetical protein